MELWNGFRLGVREFLSMLDFSGWGCGVWVVFRVLVRACSGGEGGM